jgi:glycosyltransferase involved in cell wall biosynthesis
MRILFHSNAPWCGTGYGQQVAIWAPRLRDMGHEVIISAFYGLNGQPSVWNGFQILPGGQDVFGNDIVRAHYERVQADLLLTLMDVWVVDPNAVKGLNVVHWHPIDCDPMSVGDKNSLMGSGAQSIAMSKFGKRKLEEAGFQPMYAPHAIDTNIFSPRPQRDQLRKEFGVEGKFVIGMNAANKDAVRKGYPEQFYAFARFHKRHPDSVMLVHALTAAPQALDLPVITRQLGVAEDIRFTDQYAYISGMITPEHIANWYSSLDLFSCASYGEGFGIPIVEAQACGVPVVVTDHTAMHELCGSGWKVKGEPFWNGVHQGWWASPRVDEIERAYEQAYQEWKTAKGANRRKKARKFALQYDIDYVEREHWKPIMQELEAKINEVPSDGGSGVHRIGPGQKAGVGGA